MQTLEQQCYFFMCLPLDQRSYFHSGTDLRKDFVKNVFLKEKSITLDEGWPKYVEEIVDPYYMFKNYFRRHGVIFLENGTFNQFVDIVNSKLPEVLILIAHCKDGGIPETESVEFFDKMVLSDDFLRAPFIPYPLVLDLSVCKPLYLRKKMEIIHSNYSIFTSNNIKDLTIWLYTYSQIIAKMLKEHTKYLEAYVSFFKENHK